MKSTLLSLGAVVLLVSGAFACHKDTDHPAEGPVERAGRKVDDGASTVKDDVKAAARKASDDAQDAANTVKKKAKDAGL